MPIRDPAEVIFVVEDRTQYFDADGNEKTRGNVRRRAWFPRADGVTRTNAFNDYITRTINWMAHRQQTYNSCPPGQARSTTYQQSLVLHTYRLEKSENLT